MKIKTTSSIVCILIGLILVGSSLTRSSANDVWEETFENPPFDDWFLHSYNSSTGVYLPNNYPPVIADGTLQMPWNNLMQHSDSMLASAIHNSSVAYGTWSFDFHIAEGKDHEVYCGIMFIVNGYGGGNLNLTGKTWPNLSSTMRAYVIYIKSGTRGWAELDDYSITLRVWNKKTTMTTLGSKQFSSRITGSHNMTITRNDQGKFHVFLDSEHLFGASNNFFTTSEIIEIISFIGDISFDNLIVDSYYPPTTTQEPTTSTTTQEPTTSTTTQNTTTSTTTKPTRIAFGVLILSLVFTTFYIRKRKY